AAMAGEEGPEEIALALPQLALEARRAEPGEQDGGAERPALAAELFRQRPSSRPDLAEERAELFRLRRDVRRGGGFRGRGGSLRRGPQGRSWLRRVGAAAHGRPAGHAGQLPRSRHVARNAPHEAERLAPDPQIVELRLQLVERQTQGARYQRRVLRPALYGLLVASALLTFWAGGSIGGRQLGMKEAQAAPILFGIFLIVFAVYRLALVRAKKYPAATGLFQIGLGALVWVLLLP